MNLEHCHLQGPYLNDGLKCLRGQLSWRLTSVYIHHNHPTSSALPHPCSRRSTCYPRPSLSVSSPCQADQSPLFCLAVFTLPRDFSHTQGLSEGLVGAGQDKERVSTGAGGGACQNPAAFPEHPGKVIASLLPTDGSKVILSSSSEYPVVTQTH